MLKIIFVGTGGFAGSVCRYLTAGAVQRLSGSASFPWGTFAVNFLGCLLIGGLAQLSESRGLLTDHSRAFLFFGFLGGFTTFSAFGNETFSLLREGESGLALANAAGQVLLCLGAVWAGRSLTLWLWR